MYIGNDIVDLTDEAYQYQHLSNRWMDKVFTCAEQSIIRSATHPQQMLWTMWACKESFFKAYSKSASKEVKNFTRMEVLLAGKNRDHTTSFYGMKVNNGLVPCQIQVKVNEQIIESLCFISTNKRKDNWQYQHEVIAMEGISRAEMSVQIRQQFQQATSRLLPLATVHDVSYSYEAKYAAFAFSYAD